MTTFTHPAAVDAWDAWFRWRERGELRDLTIDETWRRVAAALAAAERGDGPLWSKRFFDAFAQWRLLPDERLLRHAGVPDDRFRPRARRACLNVAAFVSAPRTPAARFELHRFEETAALAVRLLDDTAAQTTAPRGLRIGLIGMADALAQLGVPYQSQRARQETGAVAAALARGCLEGAVRLAAERGPRRADVTRLTQRWRARGLPSALIEKGIRWGVRYEQLTAIDSQPRLALLANNVADALDPRLRSDSSSQADSRPDMTAAADGGAMSSAPIAQLRLRATVQQWIDAPIDYPLLTRDPPSPRQMIACVEIAARHGLPPPRWRSAQTRSGTTGRRG